MEGLTTRTRWFNTFLIVLTTMGFVASLILNIRASLGFRLPLESLSTILHLATMIIVGLIIPSFKKLGRGQDFKDPKIIFRGLPTWMRSLALALVIYFAVACLLIAPSLPSEVDMSSPVVIQFSTAIYTMFYFLGFAVLLSWRKVGIERF